MRIGINSAQDFMSFLIRRRWWVIVPFIALSCLVAILTKALPRLYVSETLVVLTPRDVPENFVMDLTTSSSEQRLRMLQRTITSRTNLLAILKNHKDEMDEFRRLNDDEAVEKLEKQIDIKFNVERDGKGAASVIFINTRYQHRDQLMAQKIAGELTELFTSGDKDARATYVEGTTTFLANQLEIKEKELETSDNEVRVLKSRHLYELPERLEGNQRDLDRLYDDRRAVQAALDRIATTRLNYEQTLAQLPIPEFLPAQPRTATTIAAAIREKNPTVDAFLKAKTEYELEKAKRPGETHPDVARAKAIMDRLQKAVPPDLLESALNPPVEKSKEEAAEEKRPNPAYSQYQNTMRELQTEYEIKLKEKASIEASIARISGRVDRTPQVELSLSEATRDNADIRKERDELNHDLTKAELSKTLENTAHGPQFRVVDDANYPLEPEKPNKGVVLAIGCLVSLALAIAFAFIVDLSRQRVWTQSEIEGHWGVPVMVDIPAIVSDSDQIVLRKKRMAFATMFVAAFAVYSVFLYGVYLKNNYILQQLDPVLQKLVYRQ